MRLGTTAILFATAVAVLATEGRDTATTQLDEVLPPVKLDKNLRRALLKALADLEAESAEQRRKGVEADDDDDEDNAEAQTTTPSFATTLSEITKKIPNEDAPMIRKTIFSFDGFPGDEEIPGEDKLQNSSYVEVDKYVATGSTISPSSVSIHRDDVQNFQVHNVILSDKSKASYTKNLESFGEQVGTKNAKNSSSSSVNSIESVTLKPSTLQLSESLLRSASSGIAAANALESPRPTVSSPTVSSPTVQAQASVTLAPSTSFVPSSPSSSSSPILPTTSTEKKEKEDVSQEVKIFQAPLVAAFTVQQDERGVPKSVVPIYRPSGDGQALTLQEQLDFKQKLLEKQLVELQQQQLQQTQFLARQQQLYEQQLRQKQQQQIQQQQQQQQQQLYLQEQARLKQIEQQRLYQQQQQQQQQKQQQLQQQQQQQQQFSFDQNSLLTLQPPLNTPNVRLQPSVSLELPKPAPLPLFQINFPDQLRTQQQLQQQQLQLQQQQQLQLQQQRLQQSFAPFPADLQLPIVPATRFHRQEAFGNVGNFGFNDNNNNNNRQSTVNNFPTNFNVQQSRSAQSNFNGFNAFRETRPQTPAKQIQHLLFQSGVAGDLGTPRGSGGPEDLNIVSKVLALNVGALPTNSLQFGASQRFKAPSGLP